MAQGRLQAPGVQRFLTAELAQVRIRPPSWDDLDELAALVESANTTYREWAGRGWQPPGAAHERLRWQERLEDRAAWNAVAEADGHILGCASFTNARTEEGRGHDIAGVAHLSRMFVLPEHWGRGVGGLLLTGAVEEMRGRGYREAQLFTPVANARARRFYERNGWRAGNMTRRWQDLVLVQYRRVLPT